MKLRLLSILLVMNMQTASAVQTYIATQLPLPPGAGLIDVTDINDAGAIVGNVTIDIGIRVGPR
jgi:hypothetical protein